MFGSPLGGAHGKGCARQALSSRRANGAYRTRPLGGAGGGKQRASNEQARRQMVGSPRGGAWEGVRAAAPRPQGGRLLLAPLGGAGENCSRQGYCAPDVRGRRGLASSICVISACANIHRISPQCCPAVDHGAKGYLLIVVQARQVPQRQQRAKGYPLSFFPIAPHLQRGNMRKNDFFGRQGTCAPELRGLNRG